MLGAIALTAGARDLKGYINDMKERGQEPERIEEVQNALHPYSSSLEKVKIVYYPDPDYVMESPALQERRKEIMELIKSQGLNV